MDFDHKATKVPWVDRISINDQPVHVSNVQQPTEFQNSQPDQAVEPIPI